jgi:hypothetical protein
MTAILDPATSVRGGEPTPPPWAGGRERIVQAASALFTRYGTRTVGSTPSSPQHGWQR